MISSDLKHYRCSLQILRRSVTKRRCLQQEIAFFDFFFVELLPNLKGLKGFSWLLLYFCLMFFVRTITRILLNNIMNMFLIYLPLHTDAVRDGVFSGSVYTYLHIRMSVHINMLSRYNVNAIPFTCSNYRKCKNWKSADKSSSCARFPGEAPYHHPSTAFNCKILNTMNSKTIDYINFK